MNHQSELRSRLAGVRQRWFRVVALRTVGRATAAASAPILLAIGIDRLAAVEGLPLVALAAAVLLVSVALVGGVIWRMQRRPDDRHVARFVEERVAALPGGEPLDDALV